VHEWVQVLPEMYIPAVRLSPIFVSAGIFGPVHLASNFKALAAVLYAITIIQHSNVRIAFLTSHMRGWGSSTCCVCVGVCVCYCSIECYVFFKSQSKVPTESTWRREQNEHRILGWKVM